MSPIHNAHSFLDEYLPQWTEETLKRQRSDSLSHWLECQRNTSQGKWKQTTSTLPSIPPPSQSDGWFCVSDHKSPTARESRDPDTPEAPFPRKPSSGIPERAKVATTTGSLLWEKKSGSVGLLEPEPSPFHLRTREFNTVWLTHPSSTHGATPQVNL